MKFAPALSVTLAAVLGCATASAQTSATATPAAQLTPSQHGHDVVPVLIHDKQRNLVPNLPAADFTLPSNTHPQTTRLLAPDTTLPLTLRTLTQTAPGMSN